MLASKQERFVSFDGGVANEPVDTVRPDRYRDLESLRGEAGSLIARGGGYSYAAASYAVGSRVSDFRSFDRILSADFEKGTVECEGGTTLLKLYELLSPRGWFLPVQPGYPQITVAGCIASDVHGKNQFRDGTFRRHVESLTLFHPDHGMMEISRKSEPALFDLTCGGFGLTGVIVAARLKLSRLPEASVRLERIPVDGLAEVAAALEKEGEGSTLLYTWHDLTRRGRRWGHGFVYAGRPDGDKVETRKHRERVVSASSRSRLRLQLLNRFTAAPFNRLYGLMQQVSPSVSQLELFDFLFPVARKVLYFELFGRRGFHEYQVIIQRDRFEEYVEALRRIVEKNGAPIVLASCKLFRGEQSLLRFDASGICLALDFPRDRGSASLCASLDELTIRLGAIPNIVKDSRLPRDVVERSFPHYAKFSSSLRAWDPSRLFRSELSERLGI